MMEKNQNLIEQQSPLSDLTNLQQNYSRYQKICNPAQYFKIFQKLASNKSKLLKQLQQLDIDLTELKQLPLNELQIKSYQLLKNSYSFKYIGIKDNQIGIMSKRIKPENFNKSILPKVQNDYLVTGFFYPKPLKTVVSGNKKVITTENLENEIKKYFPKYQKKQMKRTLKVTGSWKNLKCANKIPGHLQNKDCNIQMIKTGFRSYSRTLERIGQSQLEMFNNIKKKE